MMIREEENSHIVYISIGSNMGDKRLNCDSGISALAAADQIDVIDQSSYYRTEPVDYEDQDWFVNCVAKLRTKLSPAALIKVMKAIEFRAALHFLPTLDDLWNSEGANTACNI